MIETGYASNDSMTMCIFCNTPTRYRYTSIRISVPVCPICSRVKTPADISPEEAQITNNHGVVILRYKFECDHEFQAKDVSKAGLSAYRTLVCPTCGNKKCVQKTYECNECGDEFSLPGSTGHGQPKFCDACKVVNRKRKEKRYFEERKARGYGIIQKEKKRVEIDNTPPNILDYMTGVGNFTQATTYGLGGF
jgi:hypothetical protein